MTHPISRRNARSGSWQAILTLSALAVADPVSGGVSLSLSDAIDPVPPGGTVTYNIRVNNNGASGASATGCFNPPPECIAGPAQCGIQGPRCVGNSFTGFNCDGAANAGDNCGVGDPPVADATLCVPLSTGTCIGGSNTGLSCNAQADCPGQAFSCVRAFNEGAYCGTGNPPIGIVSLCIANPIGICASGENFGLECVTDEDCPSDGTEGPTDLTSIALPIPVNMSFFDASHGGIVSGNNVTWTLVSNPCAGPDGVSGTAPCPVLSANLLIDLATPVGTVLQNTASAVPPDGTPVVSSTIKTTVGTFHLNQLLLGYIPNKTSRDRMLYRVLFTLGPGASIDPSIESFRIQVNTPTISLVDLALAPGQIQPSANTRYSFTSGDPGLRGVTFREVAPSHYSLRVVTRQLTMPLPDVLDVTVTLTLGDDVLTQPISLFVQKTDRRYVGRK